MNKKPINRAFDSNKTQILLAAQKLFSEKGYKNTSIRDIADHVGTNCSMVNYHFKTKENLYIQIIEDLWPSLDYTISETETGTDAAALLKDFVFKSIQEAYLNAQLVQLCLENKIFPVSEKADSIIRKMTDAHYGYFKILAEKANFSEVRLLYTSIFALVVEVLVQDKNSDEKNADGRPGIQKLLLYVKNNFLCN